ncbi:MAG TPA: serine hydrolase [Candidatus Methylomirabilis sp.]|nr:serine hydrolase [Candidatus Methylomirabilis sp.]
MFKIFFSFFLFLFSLSALPAWAADGVAFDDGGVSASAVISPTVSLAGDVSSPVQENVIATTSVLTADVSLDKSRASLSGNFSVFNDNFKLSFAAGTFLDKVTFSAEIIGDDLSLPWKLEKISPVYQFEVADKTSYDGKQPLTLEIKYTSSDTGYKRIFFYDNNYQSWRELSTTDHPEKSSVTAKIFLPFARVAVFSDPAIRTIGKASWYSYKKGNFAASVEFPKGSKLRVYNLANGKFVDVVINDFGPDRQKHPDRVLDLDKVAFKKIAKAGQGILDVRIQPLAVVPDSAGRLLGVPQQGALSQPDIKAAAAIVINEDSGAVLWEKNPSAVLPLASLSKLVAMKVFFDQRPSLNTTVTYKKQDELYNYEYCKPEESARLTVKDGDTLTVENLVYAALVGSANNAVESLVRVSGLPRDVFIAKMNEYAAAVGATSTHFIEPTGLSPQNVSTAREYAMLVREIFKNPVIQKVSVTPKYTFATLNTKVKHTMINTNNFIRDGVFAAANNLRVTGSKTGYLDKYNLMTRTVGANGERVIAVVFGADTKLQSLAETGELIQYGTIQLKK